MHILDFKRRAADMTVADLAQQSGISEDRLWRWTGSTWEPARPGGSASTSGGTVWIVIGVLVGVVILVGAIAAAVLYFAGPDISNVFSNLVTTPSSP